MKEIFEEIKNIESGKGELRKFGVTVGIVFGLLGGLLLWRGKEYYYLFFIICAALLILGSVYPVWLRPLFRVWMGFATVMGWVMTRVILTLLFYLVFTPIGAVARLVGKDMLNRQIDRNCASYWIHKTKRTGEKKRYENQF
jgi:hypothetical protein